MLFHGGNQNMGIEFSQRIIVTVTIDFAAWAFMVDNAENQSLHPCSPRLDAGSQDYVILSGLEVGLQALDYFHLGLGIPEAFLLQQTLTSD